MAVSRVGGAAVGAASEVLGPAGARRQGMVRGLGAARAVFRAVSRAGWVLSAGHLRAVRFGVAVPARGLVLGPWGLVGVR